MITRLFDIQNGVVIPTEHCYLLKTLKVIMETYPIDYLNVYAYIFYMTCPNADLNPFFNVPEVDKEEMIRKEVGGNFSAEDDEVIAALEFADKLYETPTKRAYYSGKKALDNISIYLSRTEVSDGRDGSGTLIGRYLEKLPDYRDSVNKLEKELIEEQQTRVRGGQDLAYDG